MFTEEAGTGNGEQHDNSDIRVLHLVDPPFDVTKGNYRVRMEWGSKNENNEGWVEFTVDIHPVACSKAVCAMNDISLAYSHRSGQIKIFLAAKRSVSLESLIWKQAPQTHSQVLRQIFATLASQAGHGNMQCVDSHMPYQVTYMSLDVPMQVLTFVSVRFLRVF